jgi:hypothetical protein
LFKKLTKWYANPQRIKEGYGSGDYEGLYLAKIIITLGTLVILALTTILNLSTALNGILNPNWYIIEKIISQIK